MTTKDIRREAISIIGTSAFWWKSGVVILCLIVSVALLTKFYPLGVDWRVTFSQLSFADPYSVDSFFNPPFTVLFLPHHVLPLHLSNAINFTLNIIVIAFAIYRLNGGWLAMALVFTSPVFFDLARTNNIDWLPLLGLVLGPYWGILFLVSKPQSLGGALLIWAKRDWKVLLIPLAAILLAFAIWGFRPTNFVSPPLDASFNFSPFPIGIPYGLYLLWQAWKSDDSYLAAVATPLLVPYIAPYSLTGVLCILSCRHKKAAMWFYFAIWAFVIVEIRRHY
ncbi:MAG: hypothetical protein KDJ65_22945 [Anaerolineae bacterium]|nr:hypothetical protein [Anaerolineae bacterium]